VDQQKALIACPEKALLDHWHLEIRDWDLDRMIEMRFEDFEMIGFAKLKELATRFESPRLMRAVAVWNQLAGSEIEETVEK
jgi:hypothetical protein